MGTKADVCDAAAAAAADDDDDDGVAVVQLCRSVAWSSRYDRQTAGNGDRLQDTYSWSRFYEGQEQGRHINDYIMIITS